MTQNFIDQCAEAAAIAGFNIYGRDFLCRAMAILYCYGGGPGGEYFHAPVGQHVAAKSALLLEEAILNKEWETVKLYQQYVGELQANKAPWLERTLDKLNIPPTVIKFKECFGAIK